MGALIRTNRRRVAHGGRQRRRYVAIAAPTSRGSGRYSWREPLPPDDDLTCLPVDVVEGHEHDLARAEAKSGEDQQDGEIALAGWSPLITLPEQASDFMRRERWWHRRQSPI